MTDTPPTGAEWTQAIVKNYLQAYMVKRLLATGLVKADDEPTQASFDNAYEADITAIVMRALRSEGLAP